MTFRQGDIVQLDHTVPDCGDMLMVITKSVPSRQIVEGKIPGRDGTVSCSYGSIQAHRLHVAAHCENCVNGDYSKCNNCGL